MLIMGFKFFKVQEIIEDDKPVCYKLEVTVKPDELSHIQNLIILL